MLKEICLNNVSLLLLLIIEGYYAGNTFVPLTYVKY